MNKSVLSFSIVILWLIIMLFTMFSCQPAPTPLPFGVQTIDIGHPGKPDIDIDFLESPSKWCTSRSSPFGEFYCEEGEFHLINKGLETIATITDGNFADFTLQAEMRAMDGSGSYGLVFRGNDATANYYLFRIRPSGQFQLMIWSPNQQEIILIPWTDSSAIQKGQESNVLEVTAIGSQIKLSVNNQEVATTTDAGFAKGSIGLAVTEQGHAIVDTLKVWKILTGDVIHLANYSY